MKKIILSMIVAAVSFGASAQVKMCGTDEYLRDQMQLNPQLAIDKAQFEAGLKDFMKTFNAKEYRKATRAYGKNAQPKYIIPVVVHVFHNNGSENISDAQIQSEINFLNRAFRKANSDTGRIRPFFKDIAEDAQIEFRLARKDPNGNCTNGIVRVFTPLTERGNDNLKRLSSWDTKRYFNMWVVRTISRGPGVALAGYAQFPFFAGGTSSSITDGIMVIHNEFGNIGTSLPGQTPNVTTGTHEAGHWFGLYHPFQGDSCDNEGDGIQETPTTYKWQEGLRPCCPAINCKQSPCTTVSNQEVVRTPNTCGSDNPDLPDQIENFMDYYTGDSASNMFTTEQVARMHFCLNTYRRELWQPENLVRTGVDVTSAPSCPPVPAFSSTTGNFAVCTGVDFTFRDNSYNGTITAREWNFGEGATPATDVTTSPTVRWSTPGWKNITLKVTNAAGTTTKVFEKAIFVEDPNNIPKDGNVSYADWDYINDFINKGWYFENETPNARWLRTTNAVYSGGYSMVLERSSLSFGSAYSLISPTYNLSGGSQAYLQFFYSFASSYISPANTNDSRDGLAIFVSTDCGKTWLRRLNIEGSATATTPNTLNTNLAPLQSVGYYIPTNLTQWKKLEIKGPEVGTGAQLNNVRFKITFTYQGGHNLYLDNLQVGLNSSVNETLRPSDIKFEVYPNPFNQTANVSFETQSKGAVKIDLMDIAGKHIATLSNEVKESGMHKLTIDRNTLNLKNGMYFIQVKVGDSGFTHKIVLQ